MTWKGLPRSLGQVLLVVAAVGAAVAPTSATLVERWYSEGLYPPLQRLLTTLSNVTALALFDVLVLLVIGILVSLGIFRVRRRRGWVRALGRVAADVAVATAVVYLAFLLLWGLNYRRVPLRQRLEFDPSRVTPEAVEHTLVRATDELNRIAPHAHAQEWPPLAELSRTLVPAVVRAESALGLAPAVAGRPKRSLLSWYFARAAVDGMTNPFLLEILVNPEVLPFERPFVVAHEWGHLAGYAVESEASFLAWVTCLQGDVQAQYSGWLVLFLHLASDVPPASYRAAIERLDDTPRADLRAIVRRVSGSVPIVRETTREVYDRFLKANRLRSGVRSYDEVVALIVGTRFGPDGRPVLRSPEAVTSSGRPGPGSRP